MSLKSKGKQTQKKKGQKKKCSRKLSRSGEGKGGTEGYETRGEMVTVEGQKKTGKKLGVLKRLEKNKGKK